MTEKDLKFIVSILKSEEPESIPDWHAVLGFITCHRITGLFYNRSKKCGIELPPKVNKILIDTFERQKRRVVFMRNEISQITNQLSAMGLKYMLLKGSILTNMGSNEEAIYFDGERISNDIDLLVQNDGITAVGGALNDLGFVQGVYDTETNSIKPFSRLEIVKRRMNRGEVAPFVKKTENSEFPFVEVDINFSLGNTPAEGGALLKEMVDKSCEKMGKIMMRIPSNELFFLHLIMHQYKESCLYFMVERSKDLDLYKLVDIYYLIKSHKVDFSKFESLVHKHSLCQQVGTVLKQVGEIFMDNEIIDYASQFESKVPFVIDYDNKKKYEWTGSVIQRLCSLDSRSFLKEVEYD